MEEVAVGEVTVGETGTLDASAAELDAGGGVRGRGEEEVERVRAAVAVATADAKIRQPGGAYLLQWPPVCRGLSHAPGIYTPTPL